MSRILRTVAVCAFAVLGFTAKAADEVQQSVVVMAEAYSAFLNSAQEVPTNASTATGYARVKLNEAALTIDWTIVFTGLSSAQNGSHIHGPAAIGANVGVAINFGVVGGTSGTISGSSPITPTQIAQMRSHLMYVNVHSVNFPNGEIRGQLAPRRSVDYDGDGATDLSVLRFPGGSPAPITYFNQNTTSGFQAALWGDASTDFPAPGDYDGDGKDDLAVYRAGATAGAQSTFWIRYSSDNSVHQLPWGVGGDIAVCRDYDGDGKTDVAIFRPGASPGAPATWWIMQSSNGAVRAAHWGTTGVSGTSGDTPVPEDWDGDGKADLAVYRYGGLSPNNTFLIQRSSDGGVQTQPWGNFQTDFIAPGDFDGDGKTDFVAVRTGALAASPMTWWILQSSNGAVRVQTFGISSDLVVQGDYDGDGRTDVALYRAGATVGANGTFWVFRSLSSTATATLWGLKGDFPVASYNAR
ncbi:MAG: CHRD domain-containing protein [Acidobacteria bacterium]|nr:CHRD domain-containing protein [Acidobacteriota bacterium]